MTWGDVPALHRKVENLCYLWKVIWESRFWTPFLVIIYTSFLPSSVCQTNSEKRQHVQRWYTHRWYCLRYEASPTPSPFIGPVLSTKQPTVVDEEQHLKRDTWAWSRLRHGHFRFDLAESSPALVSNTWYSPKILISAWPLCLLENGQRLWVLIEGSSLLSMSLASLPLAHTPLEHHGAHTHEQRANEVAPSSRSDSFIWTAWPVLDLGRSWVKGLGRYMIDWNLSLRCAPRSWTRSPPVSPPSRWRSTAGATEGRGSTNVGPTMDSYGPPHLNSSQSYKGQVSYVFLNGELPQRR